MPSESLDGIPALRLALIGMLPVWIDPAIDARRESVGSHLLLIRLEVAPCLLQGISAELFEECSGQDDGYHGLTDDSGRRKRSLMCSIKSDNAIVWCWSSRNRISSRTPVLRPVLASGLECPTPHSARP